MFGCPSRKVLPTCAAIEFIHAHSLILARTTTIAGTDGMIGGQIADLSWPVGRWWGLGRSRAG